MISAMLAAVAVQAALPPEIVTGADVVRVCRGETTRDTTYCIAYIAGVNDTFKALYEADFVSFKFCLPDRITVGSVARAVSQEISDDSSLWSTGSGGAVVSALLKIYPCPTSGE